MHGCAQVSVKVNLCLLCPNRTSTSLESGPQAKGVINLEHPCRQLHSNSLGRLLCCLPSALVRTDAMANAFLGLDPA